MPVHTLLDAARLTHNDVAVGLIEENLTSAPEAASFLSRVIPGTSYKVVVASGDPTTGFTAANEGIAPTKSTLEQRLHECYIFRAAVAVDLAVQRASEGLGVDDLEMIEASRVTRAALREIGSQIWYGTTNDAKGFGGLKAFTPKTLTAGTIGSSITVDAAGTTAGTASSIYAVKFGLQDVHLIFGNNQTLELGEFRDQMLADASGGQYAARVAQMTAWIGMQIGSVNSVGRILNVTADSGKTASDSLISQLMEKFPVGYVPDAFYMSRRSAAQIARSRPVTIFSQAGVAPNSARTTPVIASRVNDWEGIPIITTDSILNTDALE